MNMIGMTLSMSFCWCPNQPVGHHPQLVQSVHQLTSMTFSFALQGACHVHWYCPPPYFCPHHPLGGFCVPSCVSPSDYIALPAYVME